MARRSLRVATYLRCTLLTRPEHDMCRRSQILRIYWALSTHACAASSRDGATAAFLTGRRSKLRTGTLFNFHAKDGSVNSVVRSVTFLWKPVPVQSSMLTVRQSDSSSIRSIVLPLYSVFLSHESGRRPHIGMLPESQGESHAPTPRCLGSPTHRAT